MSVTLYHGDCLQVLPTLPEKSVDAVITDSPYHLSQLSRGGSPRKNDPDTPFGRHRLSDHGFMSLNWDGGDVAFRPETWEAMLRVLKPGGYLASFGGSRTFHHMAVAIEAGGFEYRDTCLYLFGTGYPKGMDVARAIDKAARGVPQGTADPTSPNHGKYKSGCSDDNPSGRGFGAGPGQFMNEMGEQIERELVPEAEEWRGWNVALKPAYEAIVLARRPLEGTVANNVLKYGTGALNIGGCRVPAAGRPLREVAPLRDDVDYNGKSLCGRLDGSLQSSKAIGSTDLGRWPANILHDGSDELMEMFASFGEKKTTWVAPSHANNRSGDFMGSLGHPGWQGFNDSGTAARFFNECPISEEEYRCFYTSKASRKDRAGSSHPTVKPIKLLRWICRLITPPGGTVLDPFAGSGTTGQAAIDEGFNAILVEREHQYCEDIRRRLMFFIDRDETLEM